MGDITMKIASFLARRKASISAEGAAKMLDYAIPLALVAAFGAEAAYAGTDTTFNTALTKFSDFLQGSGGKIITVLSLAGGIVGLASGRFSLAERPKRTSRRRHLAGSSRRRQDNPCWGRSAQAHRPTTLHPKQRSVPLLASAAKKFVA
jgi:conjugal transfer pilus assembly protein TraA